MATSHRDAENIDQAGSEFTESDSGHTATPEEVVATALTFFAEDGFSETKLEKIAKASGMSKRMIHYHFGDKKGLYIKAVSYALRLLRPEAEAMQLDSAVPVDGVRKIVEALYTCITKHPEAVRLLLMENLHSQDSVDSTAAYSDESNVLLNLDKLLMLGQDAGAFRPGIAAEDVLVLISSLGYYRLSNQLVMDHLFDVDLSSEANIEGMRRLVVDTVLAFLTSNLPNSEASSYLSTNESSTKPKDAEEYSFDTDLFEG